MTLFLGNLVHCYFVQVHVLTREMVHLGMVLLKYLPLDSVDALIVGLAELHFGDMTKYGIVRPSEGPFYLKGTTGRSPVIDVGTLKKIESGEIQVHPPKDRYKLLSFLNLFSPQSIVKIAQFCCML